MEDPKGREVIEMRVGLSVEKPTNVKAGPGPVIDPPGI